MVSRALFLLLSAPLKGIPSRVPTSGFRTSVLGNNTNRPPLSRTTAGRKEGGVKLLDIADQPLGYAAAKKRKKMQETEDAKKAASENVPLQSPPSTTTTTTTTTPDYAAGLSSTPTYAPATPQPAVTTVVSVTSVLTTTASTTTSSVATTPTVVTARPVPPLLAQRTVITADQATATAAVTGVTVGTPVVLQTRPVQQVTQIRIQPQPAGGSLQRRGLALTVCDEIFGFGGIRGRVRSSCCLLSSGALDIEVR